VTRNDDDDNNNNNNNNKVSSYTPMEICFVLTWTTATAPVWQQ
jgi:hypothetical protein